MRRPVVRGAPYSACLICAAGTAHPGGLSAAGHAALASELEAREAARLQLGTAAEGSVFQKALLQRLLSGRTSIVGSRRRATRL